MALFQEEGVLPDRPTAAQIAHRPTFMNARSKSVNCLISRFRSLALPKTVQQYPMSTLRLIRLRPYGAQNWKPSLVLRSAPFRPPRYEPGLDRGGEGRKAVSVGASCWHRNYITVMWEKRTVLFQ